MDKKLLFEAMMDVTEIVDILKKYEEEVQLPIIGMCFDILYGRKSPENAKRLQEAVEAVNEEVGFLEDFE